jgi:hypothetical protein
MLKNRVNNPVFLFNNILKSRFLEDNQVSSSFNTCFEHCGNIVHDYTGRCSGPAIKKMEKMKRKDG